MHCLLSRRASGRAAHALALSALFALPAHAADEFAVTPAQMQRLGMELGKAAASMDEFKTIARFP